MGGYSEKKAFARFCPVRFWTGSQKKDKHWHTIMKKTSRSIYPRIVARKRPRPWRRTALVGTCLAVSALFFFNYDDLKSKVLSHVTSEPAASPVADGRSVGGNEDRSEEKLSIVAITDSTHKTEQQKPAFLPANAEEDKKPDLLLATVGNSFSKLVKLPFFLPSHDISGDISEDSAGLEEVELTPEAERDEEASRYTVEDSGQGLIFHSAIAKGDTVGVILNEWLSVSDIGKMVEAAKPICSLTNIREGKPFRVECGPDGGFVRFVYEMDQRHCLVVEKQDADFAARQEAIVYETQLARVKGTISSSLFEAVTDTGERAGLAVSLAEIFSCEIDFIKEIRQGDHFEVLVEKLYRDDEFKGYGNMVAARFTSRNHTYEAYLFPGKDGRLRHFNADGEALQKILLKAPLAFTRVSSGYSMRRMHPVFGYVRPHQGVDYAAPTGTPIMAVGDGVVTRVGWGNGYGKMVVIKHNGGLESQYAHMSRFADGLKKGSRVKQGQTIGYVGATGVATGPHLDFRLKQNGNFVDPAKLIVPREDPVSKKRMAEFKENVARSRAFLNGESALAQYTRAEWNS